VTDHSWPELVSTEWKHSYRFRPEEGRGLLGEDVEEVQASIGACAPSIQRGKVVAEIHFRSMLLAMEVDYPGAPDDWSTGLNASSN
jgi:hypothetical protein